MRALTTDVEVIVSCGDDVGAGCLRRLAGGHGVGKGGAEGATVGRTRADARHADAQAPHCDQLVVRVSQVPYGNSTRTKETNPFFLFPFFLVFLFCDPQVVTSRTAGMQSELRLELFRVLALSAFVPCIYY